MRDMDMDLNYTPIPQSRRWTSLLSHIPSHYMQDVSKHAHLAISATFVLVALAACFGERCGLGIPLSIETEFSRTRVTCTNSLRLEPDNGEGWCQSSL